MEKTRRGEGVAIEKKRSKKTSEGQGNPFIGGTARKEASWLQRRIFTDEQGKGF